MSWFLVFLGFCLLIILHEAGHFVAAKKTGMRVETASLFFGPILWSVTRGETKYCVKAIPLGGSVKISGMTREEEIPPEFVSKAYYNQKVWKRIVTIFAGPAVNIVLCLLILVAVFWIGGLRDFKPEVGETRSGAPAASVLQKGDHVLAVDGQSFAGLSGEDRIDKWGETISADKCPGTQTAGCAGANPVEVEVRRDGQVKTFSITPTYDTKEGRMLIGLSWGGQDEWTPIGFGNSVTHSLDAMGEVASRTAHVFSHIFESKERGEISGVVGTSDVGHSAIEAGWREALLLLALVSLSLGMINLLPILPLDGGHIFWAIVEKLRGGRPVSLFVMERAAVVGFALVMIIVFIGLGNDIGRITGEGFGAR
jgi:regulator of sigma E protease